MSTKALYDIRDMLCDELDEIARKGDLNIGDLDILHKLTSTIKNLYKIEMFESDGGYSADGDWSADIRGTYGGRSNRGRKRDSMGRYSRTGEHEHMREKLRDMMRDADDDKVKEALRRCMALLEND